MEGLVSKQRFIIFINKQVKHTLLERAVAFEICMSTDLNSVSFSPTLRIGAFCYSQARVLRDAHGGHAHPYPCSCHCPSQILLSLCANIKSLWFTKMKPAFHIRSLPSCPNLWSWVPWELIQMLFVWHWAFEFLTMQMSNSGWEHFLCLFPIFFTPTSILCVKYLH